MICPICDGRGKLRDGVTRCHACAGTGSPSWGRARRTDPETSHAAASSVNGKLRDSQAAVLAFLRTWGEASDEGILESYPQWAAATGRPPQSPSGLRTRRAELTDRGLVLDTGRRTTLKSGRRAIVWTAASPEAP